MCNILHSNLYNISLFQEWMKIHKFKFVKEGKWFQVDSLNWTRVAYLSNEITIDCHSLPYPLVTDSYSITLQSTSVGTL
jgi:hypothetical protein